MPKNPNKTLVHLSPGASLYISLGGPPPLRSWAEHPNDGPSLPPPTLGRKWVKYEEKPHSIGILMVPSTLFACCPPPPMGVWKSYIYDCALLSLSCPYAPFYPPVVWIIPWVFYILCSQYTLSMFIPVPPTYMFILLAQLQE